MRLGRRTVLAGLSSGVLAWAASAQSARRRIAIIMGVRHGREGSQRLQAFRDALGKHGWHPEEQVDLDVAWADGEPDEVQPLTRRVLARQPELVVATATPIALALRAETADVPVVFVNLVDPLGAGLVKSYSAPGTNFTGLTNTEPALAAKWLELLNQVAPRVEGVGFLFHPQGSPYGAFRQALADAARTLGLTVLDLPVTDPREIDAVVSRCQGGGRTGIVVMTDLFTSTHHRLITDATTKYEIPGVFPYRFFVSDGGLISYSADLLDLYARAAGYVDQILRGAVPSEMPVQTPLRYELVVNMRAATRLGLQMPATIAARADEFIE